MYVRGAVGPEHVVTAVLSPPCGEPALSVLDFVQDHDVRVTHSFALLVVLAVHRLHWRCGRIVAVPDVVRDTPLAVVAHPPGLDELAGIHDRVAVHDLVGTDLVREAARHRNFDNRGFARETCIHHCAKGFTNAFRAA